MSFAAFMESIGAVETVLDITVDGIMQAYVKYQFENQTRKPTRIILSPMGRCVLYAVLPQAMQFSPESVFGMTIEVDTNLGRSEFLLRGPKEHQDDCA